MCFSAGADVVTGVIIGAAGIDGLRHVRRPTELWLASLPVVLAAHQLIEAFVWLGLEGRVSDAVWRPAVGLYLAIAFGVLPVLAPLAVAAAEPPGRRRLLRWFAVAGGAVALVLMYAVVRGPIEVRIGERHIDYSVDLWQGGVVVAIYVAATCGPMLLSGFRHVRWFGVANVIVAGALAWLSHTAFISLWCMWAAVGSGAIAVHLRLAHQERAGTSGRKVGSPQTGRA